MSQETAHKHTNRLINETSPYLLQHAHNPVDWHPWGPEALKKSRDEDKPILLSIGYSSCHWCHVMERESFESEETARTMNEFFVCIKVDREERPDLDEIYMGATVAITNGHGGWPMTVFLTPDQEPFFAGTYFPPVEAYGRPSFMTILLKVAELWKTKRDELVRQGKDLCEQLRKQTGTLPAQSIGEKLIDEAATQLARDYDPSYGGFGPAPKFPPSTALSFLLRVHRRTGDEDWLKIVRGTLDGMAKGGMYDHIGGGFSRYSTDEKWLVPHFEKMLYDNALLAKIYLEAYQVTRAGSYRKVASETLDYILREMTSPEGGFYSSTDADSEGEEGKFFVWTPKEVKAVLGDEDARIFCAYYDITEFGNWEGKSIPNKPRTAEQVAGPLGITTEALLESVEKSKVKIYGARKKRIPPGLDDKILTAWNGLMIGAMAEGGRVLNENLYVSAAQKSADFILERMRSPEGRLLRTYRSGRAHLNATLEDYAFLCEGLIDLYEAGGGSKYLFDAVKIGETIVKDFSGDEGGALFSTARDHEKLITRHREGHDGAMPNPNAAAALSLARLSFHLDRDDLRKTAASVLSAYGSVVDRYPRAFCKSLSAVDFLLEGPVEAAVVGLPGAPDTEAIRRELNKFYLPNRIFAQQESGNGGEGDDSGLPLLKGKKMVGGKAALYLCRNFTCEAPVTVPEDISKMLEEQDKELLASKKNSI